MKSLILCASKSHGNTRRVADRMAEVLDAEVVEPGLTRPETIHEYDLVGFGSGIYYMAVDARLRNAIRRLPTVDEHPRVHFLHQRRPRDAAGGLPQTGSETTRIERLRGDRLVFLPRVGHIRALRLHRRD